MGGKTETILVTAGGVPLYYYRLDTAKKSLVTGALASFWPPLVSVSHPSAIGAQGTLTVLKEAEGHQVAYNGHFLYTFAEDRPGQVTGQGVQDFFVATPSLKKATGERIDGEGCAGHFGRRLWLLRSPPSRGGRHAHQPASGGGHGPWRQRRCGRPPR